MLIGIQVNTPPWTANIDTLAQDGINVKTQVTYSNTINQIIEEYSFSDPKILKQTILNKIDSLNQIDQYLDKNTVGPVSKDPDPPPPPPPDPLIVTFLNDLTTLRKMITAINLNIKTNKDADYLALLTKIQTEFLISYLNLL